MTDMKQVRQTAVFRDWLAGLKDAGTKGAIIDRIQRLRRGNAGDVAPVGEGISEMRIHKGPGYRVYYIEQNETVVVLLVGGTKKRQQADIKAAKELARGL